MLDIPIVILAVSYLFLGGIPGAVLAFHGGVSLWTGLLMGLGFGLYFVMMQKLDKNHKRYPSKLGEFGDLLVDQFIGSVIIVLPAAILLYPDHLRWHWDMTRIVFATGVLVGTFLLMAGTITGLRKLLQLKYRASFPRM